MASTLTVDKIKGGSSGVALTLPTTDGSAGQLLKTDGSAVLSWATDVDTGITSVAADTTPQLGGDLDCNGAQIQWSKGADVVSATALPVLTDGNYFDVTGTTAVTSINTTGGAGTLIKLHFDAILTLTHHATDLILPGGANITTAAGDEAEFIEYAAGDYRCTNYSKADGMSVVGGGKVLQVVSGKSTSNPSTTSSSWQDTGMSLSITPSSTSSKVLIIANHTFECYATGVLAYPDFSLAQGTTTISNTVKTISHRGDGIGANHQFGGVVSWSDLDSPSTTSAVTYKTQMRNDTSYGGTLYSNKGGNSDITLIEIGA